MGSVWQDLCLNRVAIMCYGAPSGALRAPELAESPKGPIPRRITGFADTDALYAVLLVCFLPCFLLCSLLCSALCSLLSALLSALKIAPKRLENRSPNGSKTALKSILGPLGELGAVLAA